MLNLAEAGAQIEAGDVYPIVVLADERMSAISDVSTAKKLGIPVSFSTVSLSFTRMFQMTWLRKLRFTDQSHETWVYQGFLTSVA